jgi:hypothetical protein
VSTRIAASALDSSCSGRLIRSKKRETGRKTSLTETSSERGSSSSCSSGLAARVANWSEGSSSTGNRLIVASAAPVTIINATHVGAEMDPSHLFWQGMEPLAVIEQLGGLIYNAAAKDIRINPAAKINGVLDDRFGRVSPDDPGAIGLGGRYTLSRWPENSSWDFVAVGRGHDIEYWTQFLQALERVDADMAVNIEHEDQELDQFEGLRAAAETLLTAAGRTRA